jgi:hypothetical protein
LTGPLVFPSKGPKKEKQVRATKRVNTRKRIYNSGSTSHINAENPKHTTETRREIRRIHASIESKIDIAKPALSCHVTETITASLTADLHVRNQILLEDEQEGRTAIPKGKNWRVVEL